jgi:hypothetical protein
MTIDAVGHRWRSTASATAEAKGTIELADPNTLIWSMRFDSPKATPDLFIPPAEPAVTLVLTVADGKRSHATLVRPALAPGNDVQEVRASGVVGRPFLPSGTASVPGSYCSRDLRAGWTPSGRTPNCLHLPRCRPPDPARLLADDRNHAGSIALGGTPVRSRRRPSRLSAADHLPRQLLIFEPVKSQEGLLPDWPMLDLQLTHRKILRIASCQGCVVHHCRGRNQTISLI